MGINFGLEKFTSHWYTELFGEVMCNLMSILIYYVVSLTMLPLGYACWGKIYIRRVGMEREDEAHSNSNRPTVEEK